MRRPRLQLNSIRVNEFLKFYDDYSSLIYGNLQKMRVGDADAEKILVNMFLRMLEPDFPKTNSVIVFLQITWEETDKHFKISKNVYPDLGMKEKADQFLKTKGFSLSELSSMSEL